MYTISYGIHTVIRLDSLQQVTRWIWKCFWECHVNKWKKCKNHSRHFISPPHCSDVMFFFCFLLRLAREKWSDIILLRSLSLSFVLKSDLSLSVSIWSTRKPMALIKKLRKAVSISFCYQVSSFLTDVVKMALNVRL